jgi:hypothetical protein
MDLDQFNIIPNFLAPMLERLGGGWKTFRIIPVESGRGCPYGCELPPKGYFPQMGRWAWMKVAAQNRRVIIKLVGGAIKWWLKAWRDRAGFHASVEADR